MASVKFKAAWLTDPGVVADKVNEDSGTVCIHAFDGEDVALLAVADGVGGLDAGDMASKFVVDMVQTRFAKRVEQGMPRNEIFSALVVDMAKANETVLSFAQKRGIRSGTTLTALLLGADGYSFYHVGDSRAYHLPGSSRHTILQLTKDDTKTLPKQTADGRIYMKTYLTECVGTKQQFCYQQGTGKFCKNDIFVLCTDGIYKKQPDAVLQKAIRRKRNDMTSLCRDLIDGAKQRGETDNLTVAAVCIT